MRYEIYIICLEPISWPALRPLPERLRIISKHQGEIGAYLDSVFQNGDPASIGDAVRAAAHVKGMTDIARQTALGRQSWYRALSLDGRPEFATVLTLVPALGIKLTVSPA